MTASIVASPDTLRSMAFGSITNDYPAFGTALTRPVRMFRLINPSNGDLLFSLDGTNDHFFIPATSFVLYDLTTNRSEQGPTFVLAKGTQFYIKYSTAPTTKAAYLECIAGRGA